MIEDFAQHDLLSISWQPKSCGNTEVELGSHALSWTGFCFNCSQQLFLLLLGQRLCDLGLSNC